MGDAVGIGPEIILRAARQGAFGLPGQGPAGLGPVVLVGSVAVLQRAARVLRAQADVPEQVFARIERPGDIAQVPPGALAVLEPPALPEGWGDLATLPWGRVDARAGAAAAACI
ncbi:MAG TPA: hypothetical protein PLW24_13065, partial [Burkholderiaceae bacterium]|nr:hypothetical protein [Burkholderiaceae bacterium]